MATALEHAIREDGHTRAWYATRLGVPYWKVCRLLEGKRLFEYELARALAGLLRRSLDDLFVPVPVKEGHKWFLRFAARPLPAAERAQAQADVA